MSLSGDLDGGACGLFRLLGERHTMRKGRMDGERTVSHSALPAPGQANDPCSARARDMGKQAGERLRRLMRGWEAKQGINRVGRGSGLWTLDVNWIKLRGLVIADGG